MIYEIPFTIYTHLCDCQKQLSLQGIAQVFHEVAERHWTSLGVGMQQLNDKGQSRILSRVSYRVVSRYPKLNEQVKLRTWLHSCDGLLTLRESEILSSMNEVLIAATSSWAIINIASRHACRIREDLYDSCVFENRKALAIKPSKILMPDNLVDVVSFKAPYSSIDRNQHVYNAEYLRWISNSLPDTLHRKTILGLDVNYNLETLPHEEVKISQKLDGNQVWIQISNSRDVAVRSRVFLSE